MSASYPSSVRSYPAINPGDTIQDTDPEAAYEEITAMQQALLTSGLAHHLFPDATAGARTLGTSTKSWGLAYLKGLTLGESSELTVASGAITATPGVFRLDTESDAASDDLDTITAGAGVAENSIVILRAEDVTRVVTLKDGTGNLLLNGDFVLSATDRQIALLYDGTNWRELARSVPSAPTGTLLAADDTQVTTSSGTEQILYTYTIPANTLNVNGKTIRLKAFGSLALDADTKAIRVRLGGIGGTIICDTAQNSATYGSWEVEVMITRLASNSQRCFGRGMWGAGLGGATLSSAQFSHVSTITSETDSATIDLVVTGDGTNASDIVYEAAWVELLSA